MSRPRILSKQSSRSLSIALTIVVASGLVIGTTASFNSSTGNDDNTFATASLTAPSSLTATPNGTGVDLVWGAGSFGGGTGFGHRVMSRSMGVEPDPRDGQDGPTGTCAAADTFTTSAARTNAATTSATHANAAASVAGSYACYRVDAEYPAAPATSQWYSQNGNPVAVVMLGHVVRSLVAFNGDEVGTLEQADSFVLTFNQPVNVATGPVSTNNPTGTPSSGHDICIVSSSGTVNIGRTSLNTSCTTSQAVTVGRVTGLVMSPTGELGAYHATYTWSGCPAPGQCTTLTAQLGRRYRDNKDVSITGLASPSFQPTTSASLISASGAAPLCSTANTATSTCRPVPTGTV